MSRSDRPSAPGFRGGRQDQLPLTSYASQTVMLAAERNDLVKIQRVVNNIESEFASPSEVSVIKRTETYYGPELLVHSEVDGEDYNYLITAPGPGRHLCLWAGEVDPETGKRSGWYPVAEVEAELSVEQAPYQTCNQCGELIRTIYHERESVLDQCSRA